MWPSLCCGLNLFQFHLILIANGFKIEFQLPATATIFGGSLTNGPDLALDPDMGSLAVAAFVCADSGSACVCFQLVTLAPQTICYEKGTDQDGAGTGHGSCQAHPHKSLTVAVCRN